jgi:hypothetical protein
MWINFAAKHRPKQGLVLDFTEFQESFRMYIDEKKSPYDKETLDKYKKEHEAGKDIPFGVKTSLIAQGMIPREGGPDKGKKVKSPEYK